MDIEDFEKRENLLTLREKLLSIEEDRLSGRNGYTLDEFDAVLAAATEKHETKQISKLSSRVR